ncbi:MAG: hypothetical protein SH868_14680 [Bythopirellula sp.]|nr:hypothetical protein [Bythopirellula sp.]
MHRATKRFWQAFGKLQPVIQELARKNFNLLKADSRHPSLHFKKVGDFWSARVGADYRALAIEDGDDFVWVWIGHHEEYDRLIKT